MLEQLDTSVGELCAHTPMLKWIDTSVCGLRVYKPMLPAWWVVVLVHVIVAAVLVIVKGDVVDIGLLCLMVVVV